MYGTKLNTYYGWNCSRILGRRNVVICNIASINLPDKEITGEKTQGIVLGVILEKGNPKV
jgi:hypothetical protein